MLLVESMSAALRAGKSVGRATASRRAPPNDADVTSNVPPGGRVSPESGLEMDPAPVIGMSRAAVLSPDTLSLSRHLSSPISSSVSRHKES